MKWTTENISDQTGKTVIVTGANSGIGKEAARQLAAQGALVVMAVRSLERGQQAKADILLNSDEAQLEVMKLDLSSLKSVKDFAQEFSNQYKQLDLLINNAGVMVPPYTKTDDGFELQMGVNHLGHFALTARLMNQLNASNNARVVNVSSLAHTGGDIDFTDLNWEQREYKPWQAYSDSKLANLYFTYELARRTKEQSITVVAAHPGLTRSNLQQHSLLSRIFIPIFGQSAEMGSLPTLRAAVDSGVESGDYFGPGGWREFRGYPVKVDSNSLSKDRPLAEKLWEESEQITGVKFEF